MLDAIWIIVCTVLVATMQAGFMCLESGLTRSKNSINVAIKNLADFGLAVMLFWLFGYALMFGQSWQGWSGTTDFLFVDAELKPTLFFLFQAMFCGTAVTIISGAIAERTHFISYLIIATLVSGLVYPLFGHWAWHSDGWLAQLGFIDFAGSTVVHSLGAWVAWAVLLLIGARQGRFPTGQAARKIHGHSMPMAILGTLLLWVGWFGFNGGSLMALDERVGGILLNTLLAGSAGMLVALVIEWIWRQQATVEALMNGCLAGLVAVTASCNMVSPAAAVVIGCIGGIIMVVGIHWLEARHIDDAVGAIPVHLFAGIWGTIAVALFAPVELLTEGMTRWQQMQVQFIGVVTCGVWAFSIAWLLLVFLNLLFPMRISVQQEEIGLNITEHGASTELHDLLTAMEQQATTGDISQHVHEETFTEVGKLAHQYNRVLDRLRVETEQAHKMALLAEQAQQRTAETNEQLQDSLDELRRFNQITIGRELRMIELKKEINQLAMQLNLPPRYQV